MSVHIPVLVKEVLEYLNPQAGQKFIDATLGGGGHTQEILQRIGANGKILALDADCGAVEKGIKLFSGKNLSIVNANFGNLKEVAEKYGFLQVDGILADLGLSSDQLENSGRGFTFQKDEPLDMRFDTGLEISAADILNFYSQDELKIIFENYGEYRLAGQLAVQIRKIRKKKPFKTTFDLVEAVRQVQTYQGRGRIHPATLVFQALRVAVNQELEVLANFLPQAIDLLVSGGRLAVIAFQGAEDRMVKVFFRTNARKENPNLKILTKKPIMPTFDEIKNNLRGRSAKLRVVEKI